MRNWKYIIAPILVAFGGLMSRWHGGGFVGGSPKLLKAFLWSAPFSIASGALWAIYPPTLFWGILWATVAIVALAVLLWSMVFKNTGHGGGMDLSKSPKEPNGTTPETTREPEKLEYLILWLHGRMPQYWYDALLLSVIGLFSTLGAAIAFGMVSPLSSIPLVLGGLLGKPLGYMIGGISLPDVADEDTSGEFDEPTEVGEFLTGVFAYAGLAVAIIIAFVTA